MDIDDGFRITLRTATHVMHFEPIGEIGRASLLTRLTMFGFSIRGGVALVVVHLLITGRNDTRQNNTNEPHLWSVRCLIAGET